MKTTKPNRQSGAPQQTPPVLSVHRLGSTYVLRVMDLKDSPLAIGVAKLLVDASDLVVVTPTDTRTFHFGPTRAVQSSTPPQTVAGLVGADNDEITEVEDQEITEIEEGPEGEDPQERAFRLGQQAERSEPGARNRSMSRTASAANEDFEGTGEDSEITDGNVRVVGRRGNMKVVRRPKQTQLAGVPSTCGRCRGRGQVAIALESGQATSGTCPICKGSGQITTYGSRPGVRR